MIYTRAYMGMPVGGSEFGNWWSVLPAFSVKPSLAFFGLDKQKAHCFTVPKEVGTAIGESDYGISWAEVIDNFFGPESATKVPITLLINGRKYKASLRQINQKNRTSYQFEWKAEEFQTTREAFRLYMNTAFHEVLQRRDHKSIAVFHHLGEHTFLVRICQEGEEISNFDYFFREDDH